MVANTPTPGSNNGGIKTSFVTALTDTSTVDLEGVGSKRFEAGKVYIWVKFDNGTGNVAAVSGMGAEWYLEEGHINYIVTRDSTDGGYRLAGSFVSVPADGEYCWIQIKGPITWATTFETTAIANNALMCGTDGALTKWIADGTIATSPRMQIAQVMSVTTAASPRVLLNTPW